MRSVTPRPPAPSLCHRARCVPRFNQPCRALTAESTAGCRPGSAQPPPPASRSLWAENLPRWRESQAPLFVKTAPVLLFKYTCGCSQHWGGYGWLQTSEQGLVWERTVEVLVFLLLLLLCVCTVIKHFGINAAWAPGEIWKCQLEEMPGL